MTVFKAYHMLRCQGQQVSYDITHSLFSRCTSLHRQSYQMSSAPCNAVIATGAASRRADRHFVPTLAHYGISTPSHGCSCSSLPVYFTMRRHESRYRRDPRCPYFATWTSTPRQRYNCSSASVAYNHISAEAVHISQRLEVDKVNCDLLNKVTLKLAT